MKNRLVLAATLVALSVSGAFAEDRWYEGRWVAVGSDCASPDPIGIDIFGDRVVFHSPTGGRFSMDIGGGKTEADYAKLTEQSATITSRSRNEIGYSFLATIDADGAEAGFGMVKRPSRPVMLVAQTGFYNVVHCD